MNFTSLLGKCHGALDYHIIDDVYSQLNPAAWVNMLYHDGLYDEDAHYILDGVYHGFPVLDPDSNVPIYNVNNYRSCYLDHSKFKLEQTLKEELSSDKLSVVLGVPTQIHALGALPKKDGGVRIITDCSKPDKISVNNHMKEVFSRFSYKTIGNSPRKRR